MSHSPALTPPGPAGPASLTDYWEENSRWYRLWLEHTEYHRPILHHLRKTVQAGWRVLDIGGAGGVLAVPLAVRGADVTVLEPSRAMRTFLKEERARNGNPPLAVDGRRWEEIDPREYFNFDLIIASNSLHLTQCGAGAALEKIFAAQPGALFVASESPLCCPPSRTARHGYRLTRPVRYCTESSHVFRDPAEAEEHRQFLARWTISTEAEGRPAPLFRDNDGHYRIREYALVSLFWFERRNGPRDTTIETESP